MSEFELKVTNRDDLGKGSSRRLRRLEKLVPAVIYGGNEKPKSISIPNNVVAKLIEDQASFSTILTIKVENGNTDKVLIKAMQRHPSKSHVMHIDFMRVIADQKLIANVPINFLNEETAIGVKQQGGTLYKLMNEIEISCLPKDLPEFIEVDLSNLELNSTIHLADIQLPENVESVALSHDNNLAVANIEIVSESIDEEVKEEEQTEEK